MSMGKSKPGGANNPIDLDSSTLKNCGRASRRIRRLALHISTLSDLTRTRLNHLAKQRSHWSLLIFCHFGENLESKTRTPCMLLLDSLEIANPRRLEPDIRKFVLDIYKAEGRPETGELISLIPLLVTKVPQQKNDEECVKFVLYFINLFVENAPEDFNTEGYPYFMGKDWFSPESLDCFC